MHCNYRRWPRSIVHFPKWKNPQDGECQCGQMPSVNGCEGSIHTWPRIRGRFLGCWWCLVSEAMTQPDPMDPSILIEWKQLLSGPKQHDLQLQGQCGPGEAMGQATTHSLQCMYVKRPDSSFDLLFHVHIASVCGAELWMVLQYTSAGHSDLISYCCYDTAVICCPLNFKRLLLDCWMDSIHPTFLCYSDLRHLVRWMTLASVIVLSL